MNNIFDFGVWGEIGLIAFVLFLLSTGWTTYLSKHAFNVRIAKKHYKNLLKIKEPNQQMGFLRAINPYIYEELTLSSLKRLGHSIKRNKKYSGDGGIDGRAKIKGKKVLIQAKRYSGYISARDVESFTKLCQKKKRYGIFIHTGKTGKLSKKMQTAEVDIVSGDRMLNLIKSKTYIPSWAI